MDYKSFGIDSLETVGEAGSGQFVAVVGVFENVDQVKDVAMPVCFDRAVKEQEPPPIVWSHHWQIPPIGNSLEWGPVAKGLRVKGELFVGAEDNHSYADMVYAAMRSREGRKPALREFSFAYDIPDGGAKSATRELDGKNVPVQEVYEFFPVYEVGPTFKGCNPATELVTPPKGYEDLAERLRAVALKRGVTLDELLRELEQPANTVREGTYPPEVAELLLAFPNH